MFQFNFNLDPLRFTKTDKKEVEAEAAFISALIFTLGLGLTLGFGLTTFEGPGAGLAMVSTVSLCGGEGKPGVAWWLRAEWKVSCEDGESSTAGGFPPPRTRGTSSNSKVCGGVRMWVTMDWTEVSLS